MVPPNQGKNFNICISTESEAARKEPLSRGNLCERSIMASPKKSIHASGGFEPSVGLSLTSCWKTFSFSSLFPSVQAVDHQANLQPASEQAPPTHRIQAQTLPGKVPDHLWVKPIIHVNVRYIQAVQYTVC